MSHNEATQELFVNLYEDLRRLAGSFMARERSAHTLGATALVHEAYIRISSQEKQSWSGEREFYSVASTMMRRILINYAKQAGSAKRGQSWRKVELNPAGSVAPPLPCSVDLLALEEALEHLHGLDPRQAQIVCLRYYLGLTTHRIAALLHISARTVASEWAMARAWLHARLTDGASHVS